MNRCGDAVPARPPARSAHPSERVIRATVRSSRVLQEAPRDSSDSYMLRMCTYGCACQKRRQLDLKQMKCKLSRARRKTLEIHLDGLFVSKLVQTWGNVILLRQMLSTRGRDSSFSSTPKPNRLARCGPFCGRFSMEEPILNWLSRETYHEKRDRIHERFRSCGKIVQVRGVIFCSITDGISARIRTDIETSSARSCSCFFTDEHTQRKLIVTSRI